ncbi:MAG: family metallopeptidase [Crocinitomicaceae bacterium]|jgi:aminopeptidase N|nr:family metallopeptidase [Crocinitomicaceae bacterium]
MKTFLCLFFPFALAAQSFNRQDSLLGSDTPERSWWNVTHYDLTVEPDYATKTIKGSNTISFTVTGSLRKMQIDLDKALQIDSILMRGKKLSYERDGGILWVNIEQKLFKEQESSILVYFSGKPREAVKAPWDGGWVWSKDEKGRPWMSVACQGIGASIWYPCKDYQGDEPENGSVLTMIVPKELQAVSNGKLLYEDEINGKKRVSWKIVNPINNYNIIPYIGYYVGWKDSYQGEKGTLDCSYWVLDYELERAKTQFKQSHDMLKCFEYWFGPYPFYEDGYKLVQSPYLGMEHQSGIAYGNGFQNGYSGKDLSESGWGLKWDFIIIHESGHEWYGNNITSKDVADMWIHESFTNYSETLFTEYYYGKDAATAYVAGIRKNIENDIPIIGHYGVRNEGSGDMYYKGGNLVHLVRQLMNDDKRFRSMLREMNREFYHKTVTSAEIETFMSKFSGLKLDKVFDQYLRSKDIPVLEFKGKKGKTKYRWSSVVPGFDMKVKLKDGSWIEPTSDWKKFPGWTKKQHPEVDPDFYIKVK